MNESIQPIKSEVTSIALETLANIIAEKKSENEAAQQWITKLRQQVTNLEKEKLNSYWQGYTQGREESHKAQTESVGRYQAGHSKGFSQAIERMHCALNGIKESE